MRLWCSTERGGGVKKGSQEGAVSGQGHTGLLSAGQLAPPWALTLQQGCAGVGPPPGATADLRGGHGHQLPPEMPPTRSQVSSLWSFTPRPGCLPAVPSAPRMPAPLALMGPTSYPCVWATITSPCRGHTAEPGTGRARRGGVVLAPWHPLYGGGSDAAHITSAPSRGPRTSPASSPCPHKSPGVCRERKGEDSVKEQFTQPPASRAPSKPEGRVYLPPLSPKSKPGAVSQAAC